MFVFRSIEKFVDIEWWPPMSVTNEISCIRFDVGILVVICCALLAVVEIGCSLESFCRYLNLCLNCL